MDRETLVTVLTAGGIPVAEWGTGKAKTIDHFLRELEGEEAQLLLLRSTKVIALEVYHKQDGDILHLVEEKQVFTDGRERSRTLDSSIGEKMSIGESPIEAARRALKEELGIEEALEILESGTFERTQESPSYPGLSTHYQFFKFSVWLPVHLFKVDGYVLQEKDKTSYFKWKKE